jgi:N-methylhydantoinase B
VNGGVNTARDAVGLSILGNRIEGIVRKMTNTLFRTARSGVINTARDFSCCILTSDDRLVATAESIPVMIVAGPELITRYLRSVHPMLARGDAFLHNSPYHGNSHAADHCVLVPVLDEADAHRFTVLVKAHVADCGNSVPSSLMASAIDVYHEGALIFPCVKIQSGYTDLEDVLRMCELRIRVPDQWRGDLLGMIGAARIGERELTELAAERGWDGLTQQVGGWLAYSDQRMASALRRLPAGRRTAVGKHDALPGITDELRVAATVTVDPATAIVDVDLRDNPDALPCGLNLTEATARAAGLIGVLNGLKASVPINTGSLSRIRVQLREGCAIGIPRHPTSCSLATTHLAIRTTNIVQRALAELADGLGMAETGSDIPASGAAISGIDPRRGGKPFVGLIFLGIAAGAASPEADGWIGAEANTAGMMNNDSVEIDELLYPFRVWVNRLVPDSEGAGRHRGAPSIHVEWGPADGPLTAIWISDGNVNPAEGVRGGLPGGLASQFVRSLDGELRPLPSAGTITLSPGERLVSRSTAGGGYGSPAERDPLRVAVDVKQRWITRERARAIYRVAVKETGEVDWESTRELRPGASGSSQPA